ncbi:serine (or cysteine) peptidase inhibitor, clade H, member 2 [Megalops cyprinoides]|uniref:serine (or cysteine) peptidase inhibitor, clade H, member 2 n=1 Tax=Megalops cyprinoides TaxID=118141 RepID=UPI001864E39D|nr:serine (or cysteine) peptidase inhibitor, clade H, member 2 [Megalops cyprinoides]
MQPAARSRLSAYVLVLLVLGFEPVIPQEPTAPTPPKPGQEVSWTLGFRLYRALRADGTENPLFSPLMLAGSLGALGDRAGGTTAVQFQQILNTSALPLKDQLEVLSGAVKSIRAANGTGFNLHSSSAVFTKKAPVLDAEFLKEAQTRFRLEHVALGAGDSQADWEALHAWAGRGMGGAKGAHPPGDVLAKPGALILAHALHFRGLWDKGFEEGSQDIRSFLGTKYTKTPMMHCAGVFRHYEDMENMVQVLEMGLWGGRASLVLLLPFHVEPLTRLDRLLTPELLAKWLEKLREQSMAISLPRATLTSTLNLQKHLSALGLTDAWDEKKADFSGVMGKAAGQGELHLAGVLHWATLELTPQGGGETDEEKVGKTKLFYADHSFIVLVKDNVSGALLLMGALDQTEGAALHDEL